MTKEQVLELFEMYSDNVYRFAISYTGSVADAEDIVQEVFRKLMEKDIKIQNGKEKSYIMKMTSNMAKNYLKSSSMKQNENIDDIKESLIIREFSVQEEAVLEAVMELTYTYRVAIYLHYFEGYTFKEIARILRISTSAVSMRISRGKEMLREILKED